VDDDITDRILHPCPQCNGTALRLVACGVPPVDVLPRAECVLSMDSAGVVRWSSCVQPKRRLVVHVDACLGAKS